MGRAAYLPIGKLEVGAGGQHVQRVGRVAAVHGLIFPGDVDGGASAARGHALRARVRRLHVTLQRHPHQRPSPHSLKQQNPA